MVLPARGIGAGWHRGPCVAGRGARQLCARTHCREPTEPRVFLGQPAAGVRRRGGQATVDPPETAQPVAGLRERDLDVPAAALAESIDLKVLVVDSEMPLCLRTERWNSMPNEPLPRPIFCKPRRLKSPSHTRRLSDPCSARRLR
jgi:hypothetical protein